MTRFRKKDRKRYHLHNGQGEIKGRGASGRFSIRREYRAPDGSGAIGASWDGLRELDTVYLTPRANKGTVPRFIRGVINTFVVGKLVIPVYIHPDTRTTQNGVPARLALGVLAGRRERKTKILVRVSAFQTLSTVASYAA